MTSGTLNRAAGAGLAAFLAFITLQASGEPPVIVPPESLIPPEVIAANQPPATLDGADIPVGRSELLFRAVTPCTLVNMNLAANSTDTFYTSGTAGFTAQGGLNPGCGIPDSATALAVSIVAGKATSAGSVRAWRAGSPSPPTAFLFYPATDNVSSGGVVSIKAGTPRGLALKNVGPKVRVIVTVTGYYVPQMHGLIYPSGGVYSGSSRIISSERLSPGVYRVTFDQDVAYCTPVANAYNAGVGIYAAAYAFSTNTITVYTWYLDPTTHVEVPYSFYTYVAVIC